MKRMNDRAIMIQKRFFDALDTGIQLGRYGGIKTFCDEHGLNRTKYSRIRTGIQDPSNARYYTTIDIDALRRYVPTLVSTRNGCYWVAERC